MAWDLDRPARYSDVIKIIGILILKSSDIQIFLLQIQMKKKWNLDIDRCIEMVDFFFFYGVYLDFLRQPHWYCIKSE